ncbi:MAG: hypothetical protein RIQ52_480 [Pseudomonadota bacterium]|jgi:putative ABC transport system permease protein
MKHLAMLAIRLFWRDLRGGELNLMILMLCIAMMCHGAITLLEYRLDDTARQQAAEWLAADMVVAAHHPLPANWQQEAQALGLETAETLEFSSMLMENGQMRLASLKGVSDHYPLRGRLTLTSPDTGTPIAATHGPVPGTAWIDEEIAASLQLHPGMSLGLGKKQLAITAVLHHEPDRGMHWLSLAPRVMFNLQDIAATGLVRTGFNGHYQQLFAGPDTAILALQTQIKAAMDDGMRLYNRYDSTSQEQGRFIFQLGRFLTGIIVIVSLLTGWGLAMAARHHARRHLDQTALLMALGMRPRVVMVLDGLQRLLLLLLASIPGNLLALMMEQGVRYAAGNSLPTMVAITPWIILPSSLLYATVLLGGAVAVHALSSHALTPTQLMQRQRQRRPLLMGMAAVIATSTLAWLLWLRLHDLWLAVTLALTGLVLSGLLWALSAGMTRLLVSLGGYLPWHFRLGLHHLHRRRYSAGLQMTGLIMTLFCLSITLTVHRDLLASWQNQLPQDTPNYFAIGIQPEELPLYRQMLLDANIIHHREYPVLKGRLTTIDGQPVSRLVIHGAQGEAALRRELNLTESTELPSGNRITQGEAWQPDTPPLHASVEAQLAEQLGIHTGSTLIFSAGGLSLEVRVDSIRTLHWQDMTPNFYVILSPGSFTGLPVSWMGSFYLPEQRAGLLQAWTSQLPGISWLPVGQLIDSIRQHMTQIAGLLSELMLSAALASVLVMWIALTASSEERRREEYLLHVMGIRHHVLLRARGIEYAMMGAIAGLITLLLLEIVRYALLARYLDLTYPGPMTTLAALPLLGAMLAYGISRLQASVPSTDHRA